MSCLALTACGGGSNDGNRPDAGGSNGDGGMSAGPDGGMNTGPDSGTGTDGGAGADGGAGTDGGTGTDGGAGTDGGVGVLGFTGVTCLPDPAAGPVVEGQVVACTFGVAGMEGASATLGCEDGSGAPLACDGSAGARILPAGTSALPIDNGGFAFDTSGLAGTTAVVVWVADDGVAQARHRLDIEVIADDGTNQAPSIQFDCGGDTDGSVRVTAGEQLVCTLRFLDPDADTLTWGYELPPGSLTPVNEATPKTGSGAAPLEVTWTWSTDASEQGTSWIFAFGVSDGIATLVPRALSVTVE